MIQLALIFVLLSGVTFITSAEVKADKSRIELRLVLDLKTPTDEEDPDWDVEYVGRTLEDGLEVFQHPEYNRTLPVIILVHGLRGSAEKHDSHFKAMLMNGYRRSFNLIALNMPLYFDGTPGNLWYLLPARRAKLAGVAVGELLNKAATQGLVSAGQVHLIGFSLGAQTAGYIARTVVGNVHSIVGLDPAGPGFDSKGKHGRRLTHVSKEDARIVHLYHTNSNYFGTSSKTATADFVFNNGWHQPGCGTTNMPCSHCQALIFFTHVIQRSGDFKARSCDSYLEFKNCKCHQKEVLTLSYPPDPTANGTYYLTTSRKSPFGQGHLGTICRKERKLLMSNVTSHNDKNMSDHKKLVILTAYKHLKKPSVKELNSDQNVLDEAEIKEERSDQKGDQKTLLSKIGSPKKWRLKSSDKEKSVEVEESEEEGEVDNEHLKKHLVDEVNSELRGINEAQINEEQSDDKNSQVSKVSPSSKWHLRSLYINKNIGLDANEFFHIPLNNPLIEELESEPIAQDEAEANEGQPYQKDIQASLLSKIGLPSRWHLRSADKKIVIDMDEMPNNIKTLLTEEVDSETSAEEGAEGKKEEADQKDVQVALLSKIGLPSRWHLRSSDKDKNILVEMEEMPDSLKKHSNEDLNLQTGVQNEADIKDVQSGQKNGQVSLLSKISLPSILHLRSSNKDENIEAELEEISNINYNDPISEGISTLKKTHPRIKIGIKLFSKKPNEEKINENNNV